nr:S8 family peptidase [Kibdelosporangium sp. MJ126-NF4]CEL21411.1 Alkaline serine exoprotease A precursor [Kibdelosporangium sp. MJ126-NF4]CTQ96022.1 Alkaline serine exoprotease A precursor (EC 3.4.21.-) [Kibdelosporangium sp. MJ126-NF4]
MKSQTPGRLLALIITVTAFSGVVAGPASAAEDQDTRFRPAKVDGIAGSYIVVLKPTGAEHTQKRLLARYRGTVRQVYRNPLNGFAIDLPEADARRISQESGVEFVEQDAWATGDTTQNSPPSWGLDRVDQRVRPADSRYSYWPTGAGVHVYVLDSGVRRSHTDFAGRVTVEPDFVGDGQNGVDCHGHGTHVAGTIGGTTHGVAKGVHLHSVRVLDCANKARWSWTIQAVNWVRANARRPAVINMSLGGDLDAALDKAVSDAVQAGITVVVSAQNNAADACGESPGRTPVAITVANATRTDARYSGTPYPSNFGPCVDLFGPGTDIVSAGIASDTATATMTGTSMAAPHVTGTIAKYLQAAPAASPAQLTASLLAEATRDVVTDAGAGTPNRLLFSDHAMTGHRLVSASFTVQPGQGWSAAAQCPAGTVVTGGGYHHGSTLGIEVNASAPYTQGWLVHATNADNQARPVLVYAVCAQTPGWQIVTGQYTVPPGGEAYINASCPVGKTLLGGGYTHDSTFGNAITFSVPYQYPNVWQVKVINLDSVPRPVTTHAVCAQTPGQQQVSAQFIVQPGQGWDTVARCPAGTAVTGGGHSFFSTTPAAAFRVAIDMSDPLPQGWHVHAFNLDTEAHVVNVYAMCAAAR